MRALVIACALAFMPACAALPLGDAAAVQTQDRRAYALLESYSALLEAAADVAEDSEAPMESKQALGAAERAAAPAMEGLARALGDYVRTRSDAAAVRLSEAMREAETAVAALRALATHAP
jgi:hypothetical protein